MPWNGIWFGLFRLVCAQPIITDNCQLAVYFSPAIIQAGGMRAGELENYTLPPLGRRNPKFRLDLVAFCRGIQSQMTFVTQAINLFSYFFDSSADEAD